MIGTSKLLNKPPLLYIFILFLYLFIFKLIVITYINNKCPLWTRFREKSRFQKHNFRLKTRRTVIFIKNRDLQISRIKSQKIAIFCVTERALRLHV